jgi:trehalose 6-phosphate synthase/phosphatase
VSSTDRVGAGARSGNLPAPLVTAVHGLAGRGHLLLALDFDGVLAPIVDDPAAARPLPGSARALAALAEHPVVHLALVSGRHLDDLRRVATPPPGALLVGSHGAEFARPGAEPGAGTEGPGAGALLPDGAERDLLVRLTGALEELSARCPGTRVEYKPAGVVLHTRGAARPVAARATEEALSGPATWSGVHLTTGKEVVELSVLDVTKGGALIRLRDELGLPAAGGGVAYIGDDVTDERAFAVLDDDLGDLTVKVGAGTTAARHRIPDPPAVTRLLEMFLDLLPR